MGGVEEVKQLNETTLHWTAKIAGVKREWDAEILEQVPDRKVAWAATAGATNAGSVYFESLGTHRTGVRLVLEYDPEGFVEKVGDRLNIVSRQAQNDLEKFKGFIESCESETGAWRGTVDRDGAEDGPGSGEGETTEPDVDPGGSTGATRAGTPTAMADSSPGAARRALRAAGGGRCRPIGGVTAGDCRVRVPGPPQGGRWVGLPCGARH